MRNTSKIALALVCLIFSATAQASCGSVACSINTNWDEHSPSRPGLSLDIRYIEIKLDQLRAGSKKITAEDPTDPALAGEEVENLYTDTKLINATLDYALDERMGVAVQIPYVMRTHKHTIADPIAPTVETFDARAIGDIKLVGRYRLLVSEDSSTGVKVGLKLATGKKNVANDQGAVPGEVSLQPGNGSTDLILGAFWQQGAHGESFSYFAQAMLQTAVNHLANYTPGTQINADAGLRYALGNNASALLQVNYQYNAKDSGSTAPADASGVAGSSTGGQFLYLTPGLSYAVMPGTNLYSLVQLPLYQSVNGEQLTASHSFSVGVNHRF